MVASRHGALTARPGSGLGRPKAPPPKGTAPSVEAARLGRTAQASAAAALRTASFTITLRIRLRQNRLVSRVGNQARIGTPFRRHERLASCPWPSGRRHPPGSNDLTVMISTSGRQWDVRSVSGAIPMDAAHGEGGRRPDP
jgi:hypothetical protein